MDHKDAMLVATLTRIEMNQQRDMQQRAAHGHSVAVQLKEISTKLDAKPRRFQSWYTREFRLAAYATLLGIILVLGALLLETEKLEVILNSPLISRVAPPS